MAQNDLSKAYEPRKTESKWYKFWQDKGYFTPRINKNKKPFVIIMPPPNITGSLHLGHALVASIEDLLTRWHRMKGDPTLWLPGVDHASIAAQFMMDKKLAEEGTSRLAIGRKEFLNRMWQWAERYRTIITEQHKRLGVSCDWSRECFTMDDGPSLAVRTTFYNLYKKGLIYQGERLISWCPRCSTALSDLEVDHVEKASHLYFVKYSLLDDHNTFITVATTRPETILGDSAVAVNPNDKRYSKLIGKKVILPIILREIPIIADEAVDPSFGTGAVKITPAHDPVDFEVSQRHNLPLINIMNENAIMNDNAGPYSGQDRFICRKNILSDLKELGLLDKIDPYQHSIGQCQRCKTVVEPRLSKQWFIKIAPLAKPAIEVVKNGQITIIPEHFAKVYLNWMENIRDWCISRQLWWGHRIPVWYCKACNEIIVAIENPRYCPKCHSTNMEQDNDVLDTWFSSGLWPHSTLGWPELTEDYKYFYPTSVMETAYDILFFWVARMIMMSIENTGKPPFHTIYLHGLIRDEKGEKMSKTKGNVVDPLVLIDKYGTDALRFCLLNGNTPGNDLSLTNQRLEAGRNFANKLWNASRFVITNIPENIKTIDINDTIAASTSIEDKWILSRLNRIVNKVNSLLDNYQFGEAQRELYDFLWSEYCDWYIEIAKIRLRSGETTSPINMLIYVLETSLRLLHPFMPFITEEIWQELTKKVSNKPIIESVMVANYPVPNKSDYIDQSIEEQMGTIIETIRAIRNARAEHNVEPSKFIEAVINAGEMKPIFESQNNVIQTLARAQPLIIVSARGQSPIASKDALLLVNKNIETLIPMRSLFDPVLEKQRLAEASKTCKEEIDRITIKLSNQEFVNKAPTEVVSKQRKKLAELTDKLNKINEQLSRL